MQMKHRVCKVCHNTYPVTAKEARDPKEMQQFAYFVLQAATSGKKHITPGALALLFREWEETRDN